VDYTSANVKLIQSWRYKTLAVVKRHKIHLSLSFFRDGTINLQEFSSLWNYIQQWRTCFDSFDTDKSGNISADELNRAFRTFGYNL